VVVMGEAIRKGPIFMKTLFVLSFDFLCLCCANWKGCSPTNGAVQIKHSVFGELHLKDG
jgi:hypothetical protein